MATALLTRYGYPKVPGDQPESIIDVKGPTNYAAIFNLTTALTPPDMGQPAKGPKDYSAGSRATPAGGQTVTAQDFGLQSLDFVTAMATPDGLFTVVILPILVEPRPNPPLPTQLPDGTFSAVKLMWLDMNSNGPGAAGEAFDGANLSYYTVRLFARGH